MVRSLRRFVHLGLLIAAITVGKPGHAQELPTAEVLLQPHPAIRTLSEMRTATPAVRIAAASEIMSAPQEDSNAGEAKQDSQLIGQVPEPKTPSALAPTPPGSAFGYYGGVKQLLLRNFGLPGYVPPSTPTLPRRAMPPALDPVFPSTEFLGTNGQGAMGANDGCYAQYPFEQALWKYAPWFAKHRIRVYGWLNAGFNEGTSHHSNFPMSYIVASRKFHWDQVVCKFERVPDTVQQEHMDWGFRFTNLYGEDYRFTTAKGWLSEQLLTHNNLTGYDPVEAYGILYIPRIGHRKLCDGLSLRVGRYVSCPDIEAQLAPDNYLFTHSIMFTVDTYTQTGIQGWLQLNKNWNAMLGVCSGADTAPWVYAAVPTGQFLVRWVSNNNKDSIYGGVNDINGMRFRSYWHPSQGKDNLQQVNVNWTHVFNRRVHTATEFYYLWTWWALRGGTVSNGPVRDFGGGGGPGAVIPGPSHAIGVVNYTEFKMTDRDYLSLRPFDLLDDPHGWRTGFPTWYTSTTVGWCHRFSDLLCIRPELRWEASHGHATPYDNGHKRSQFTFACDIIQRF
jgi:hypothetical protein